jgi:uncharacterized protein YuzE
MVLRIDEKNDALYFRLDESGIIECEEVQPGVILDFDSDGRVVSIEILGPKGRVPAETLKSLHFETV